MTANDGRPSIAMAALGGSVVLAACFNPDYRHTACPDGSCPAGQTCVQGFCEVRPDIPGVAGTWMFDTAADFAAGSAAEHMTIEPRGSLTPDAYTYGGLVAHGLEGVKLWSNADTDWSKLQAVRATGAGLWRGERLTDQSGFSYVGITDKEIMSIWFEGEVWLDKGAQETFSLFGDDVAFLELAPPGTTSYKPVATASATVAIPVPVTGWYPIRIGFADGDNSCTFEFTHSDTAAAAVPWTRDRLRARTSELPGAMRTVFDRQLLGGGLDGAPPVSRFEPGDLLRSTVFPLLQGTSTGDNWSARYAGQIYIEQPGIYTLQVNSDDGDRARLATARGESHWRFNDNTGPGFTVVQAPLVAGWNDLVVDYNEVNGDTFLRIQLQGPDFPDSTEVPRARLRPVEPADDRLASSVDDADHVIPDATGSTPGTVVATLPVAGYAAETVNGIDVTCEIDSQRASDIRIELERPGLATPVTLRAPGPGGIRNFQISIPSSNAALDALLGGPVAGDWKLRVSDTVQSVGTSVLRTARLTLHTTGNPETIARSAAWTSPVLDATTPVLAIDGIAWDVRLPDGAALEVRVRTCQQAQCGDDPAYSSPVIQGVGFLITRGRYLQLRVEMTSNGVREPELRSLRVDYRREP